MVSIIGRESLESLSNQRPRQIAITRNGDKIRLIDICKIMKSPRENEDFSVFGKKKEPNEIHRWALSKSEKKIINIVFEATSPLSRRIF